MLKLKGRYDWQLINADTGKVDQEGSQWNTFNDSILAVALNLGDSNEYRWTNPVNGSWYVQLSDTIPVVGIDYRRYLFTQHFNKITEGFTTASIDTTLNYVRKEHNFIPPVGVPRTINVIGVGFLPWFYTPKGEFVSYIKLTTPITQNTNQYLYVKYTMYVSYVSSTNDLNSPSNHYLDYTINKGIVDGYDTSISPICGIRYGAVGITPFIEPINKNNVCRAVPSIVSYILTNRVANYGSLIGNIWDISLGTTDIPGPLGCIAFSAEIYKDSTWWLSITHGYNKVKDNLPSFSRVFTHPESRIAQIFSDPSYPPNSFGSLVLSGTPTNKYPIITRVKITKTGDASDIVDETFLPAAVNTGAEEITITQSFAMNDIVRFTNAGGALPSGISAGTSYYVIQAGTVIKLSLLQGGSSIDITDQGTGTHTIIRYNTGKYSLELEPWKLGTANSWAIKQMVMAVDFDGKAQPSNYDYTPAGTQDPGEGGVGWTTTLGVLVQAYTKIGSYLWTVQRSRVNGVLNMCKWYFWSIETSQAQCKFGSASTEFSRIVTVGNKIYIGTSDGIYEYDTTVPATAPALMVITGIINSAITDLVYDTVSGFMWSGHATGLSKINIGASTATQYTSAGTGLTGMTANDANIRTGQLDVYNGRVFRSGTPYCTNFINYSASWVMDDGVGWYVVLAAGGSNTKLGRLRKGTNEVVIRLDTSLKRYAVTVTGMGTGSAVQQESFVVSANSSFGIAQMCQFSDTLFIMPCEATSGNVHYTETYIVGSGITSVSQVFDYGGAQWPERVFAMSANPIDIGGAYITFWQDRLYQAAYSLGTQIKYGWNGAWTKDNAGDRYIIKTGTTALLNGTSVAFNNAVGKTWDQQFILSERFTFVQGPYKIKDNLQTANVKTRKYPVSARVHESLAISVPGAAAYTYHITEVSDPNFRDMDTVDFLTEVYEGVTRYTRYTLPAGNTFTVAPATDILSVGTSIATGTPCQIITSDSWQYLPPRFLIHEGIYYAINISPTTIKLALTYADAIGGTAIDIFDAGTGTLTIKQVVPTAGTYFAGTNGIFVFAAADTGKGLTLTYTYTLFN